MRHRNEIHCLENRRQFKDSEGDRRQKNMVSIEPVRIAKTTIPRTLQPYYYTFVRVLTASAEGSRCVSVASGGCTGPSSASGAVVPLAVCRAAVPPWPSSLLFGTSVFATKEQPTRWENGENASGRCSRWIRRRKPRISLTSNDNSWRNLARRLRRQHWLWTSVGVREGWTVVWAQRCAGDERLTINRVVRTIVRTVRYHGLPTVYELRLRTDSVQCSEFQTSLVQCNNVHRARGWTTWTFGHRWSPLGAVADSHQCCCCCRARA